MILVRLLYEIVERFEAASTDLSEVEKKKQGLENEIDRLMNEVRLAIDRLSLLPVAVHSWLEVFCFIIWCVLDACKVTLLNVHCY